MVSKFDEIVGNMLADEVEEVAGKLLDEAEVMYLKSEGRRFTERQRAMFEAGIGAGMLATIKVLNKHNLVKGSATE
jgi:hypothetical protein